MFWLRNKKINFLITHFYLEAWQQVTKSNELALIITDVFFPLQAMKKNAGFRVWILFFLIVLTFSLLFLDWYSG